MTDELPLPILPSVIVRWTEITDRRFQKLKIGYIKIPFPEEIVAGWMKDLVYLPDLTLDCLKSYAKKSVAEKGFKGERTSKKKLNYLLLICVSSPSLDA